MSKKLEVTPSELVLSAIFFLQQNDGVSAKEITRHICKKWGCKQSSVANEVKEALDKATENEIIVKKQGLYRIASGIAGNMKTIKKRMRKKKENDDDLSDADSCEQLQESCKCPENIDDPWLNSPSSHSDRISLEQIDMLKNQCDGDDDDDDEEDFLEEEDDELDFFADDQVPQTYDIKKECRTAVKSKPSCGSKGKRGAKGKNAGNKPKRRKMSKPRKRTNRRKKIVCTCKNSNSATPTVKTCQSCEAANEDDLDAELDEVPSHEHTGDECDNQIEDTKRRKTRKKGKGQNIESDDESCNCNSAEAPQEDGPSDEPKQEAKKASPKEEQAKKNPAPAEQIKRKGKEGKKSEEKEVAKTGGDANLKKDTKEHPPPSTVKATASPATMPPDKEWRRKKAKRERSSSLFRPVKKQVSSKDKPAAEQKSSKNKTTK